ncbi:hypothetical protein [Streptomyces sp. NPDC017993]
MNRTALTTPILSVGRTGTHATPAPPEPRPTDAPRPAHDKGAAITRRL